jgi:hypothetical protein
MSRSYKHTPVLKDGGRTKKKQKRQASKKVRRYDKELSDGMFYKNVYCSWDICDNYSYYTLKDALKYKSKWSWLFEPEPTSKVVADWKKWYYYK